MRIITGSLKGAHFNSPRTKLTHPMSDRVRGGLFNALGDIHGLTVFDPFGGSGALAFEAISRGAASAVICEVDKQALKAISGNIEQLKLDNAKLYFGNAKSWVRRNKGVTYDIVLADPPYDDIDRLLLELLADATKPGGIFVLSWPGKEDMPLTFEGLTHVQTNQYGDAKLLYFRRG